MTIYGRSGEPVTIVRWGTIDDIKKLDGRSPDKTDREAIANGSYLVVQFAERRGAGVPPGVSASGRRSAGDRSSA